MTDMANIQPVLNLVTGLFMSFNTNIQSYITLLCKIGRMHHRGRYIIQHSHSTDPTAKVDGPGETLVRLRAAGILTGIAFFFMPLIGNHNFMFEGYITTSRFGMLIAGP